MASRRPAAALACAAYENAWQPINNNRRRGVAAWRCCRWQPAGARIAQTNTRRARTLNKRRIFIVAQAKQPVRQQRRVPLDMTHHRPRRLVSSAFIYRAGSSFAPKSRGDNRLAGMAVLMSRFIILLCIFMALGGHGPVTETVGENNWRAAELLA